MNYMTNNLHKFLPPASFNWQTDKWIGQWIQPTIAHDSANIVCIALYEMWYSCGFNWLQVDLIANLPWHSVSRRQTWWRDKWKQIWCSFSVIIWSFYSLVVHTYGKMELYLNDQFIHLWFGQTQTSFLSLSIHPSVLLRLCLMNGWQDCPNSDTLRLSPTTLSTVVFILLVNG